jgi:hypothetical protein
MTSAAPGVDQAATIGFLVARLRPKEAMAMPMQTAVTQETISCGPAPTERAASTMSATVPPKPTTVATTAAPAAPSVSAAADGGGAAPRGASVSAFTKAPVAQAMYWPPLAVSVEPVMKPASSAARKTTQRATSPTSPIRPTGMCGRIFLVITSSGTARTISVPI